VRQNDQAQSEDATDNGVRKLEQAQRQALGKDRKERTAMIPGTNVPMPPAMLIALAEA
jgi:hypothetical protein